METHLGMTVRLSIDLRAAIMRVTEALRAEGFGILTEIDVQETMKKKLGQDFNPYVILGACNPQLAYRALCIAPEVGLLLPCNVVVRPSEGETTEVSIIDPIGMLEKVGKPELQAVAQEARARLKRVADALKA